MRPSISVLIPVYNAQKYLQDCLLSIQKQTFIDFEIICLDDGSTDASFNVLKKFQQTEPRLRVFTQKNAGVAVTRNRLLQKARAEYVAFVDADDLILPDYLKKLYTAAQKNEADITKCFFQEVSADGSRVLPAHCSSWFYKEPANTLDSRFICGYYDSIVNAKLFRSSWLQKIKISFLEGRVSEDLPFITQAFMQARQISVVPQVLYSYRKGLTGCITAGTEKMIIDWLRNMLDLQDILKACNLWNEQVASQWVKVVIWRIAAFRKLPADVRVAQTTLLQQAFSRAKQIVREGGWHTQLRWSGLFALVNVCGWQSIYFWAKLFR